MSDEELQDNDRLEMIALAEQLGRDISFKKDYVELNLDSSQGLWHLLKAVRYLSGELETGINTSIPIRIHKNARETYYITTITSEMTDGDLFDTCEKFRKDEDAAYKTWLKTPQGRRSQFQLVAG